MKNFLKSTLLFALPILTSLILLELVLRNIPNDYSKKKNYLDLNSDKIEVAYMGNSHIYYGIDPSYSNHDTFNAAHISQSLDLDLAILNKYKNNWSHLKCIVVPVDYFSLFSTLETGKEAWRIKNYSIYYNLPGSSGYKSNFELLNAPLKSNLGRLKTHFIKETSDITCNELGWGTNHNSKDGIDLVLSGKNYAKNHTILDVDSACIKDNFNTINKLIEFASIKNAKIIFLTSPGYKTYVENLDSNQLNYTVNSITQLTMNHPNAAYFNLLEDTIFCAEDFYDADHLNEKGAQKLSLKMKALVEIN